MRSINCKISVINKQGFCKITPIAMFFLFFGKGNRVHRRSLSLLSLGGGLLDNLIGAKHFHKEAINTKKMSGV